MQTESVTRMSYHEFEEIVKKSYGLEGSDWSFVATEECDNDSVHDFSPVKKECLSEYDQQSLVDLRAGKNPTYINHTIFQDLVNNDVLPAGNYLIEVMW
jgi:hypothetical protein